MKKLDLIVFPLILVSVALLILGTEIQDVRALSLLTYVEFSLGVLFSIEYMIRVAHGKLKYVGSFFGIIDLIAAMSGLIILVIPTDLLAVRVLRLFRLFSVFKALRFVRAIDVLLSALKSVKYEFMVLLVFVVNILVLASFGIHYFEHEAQPEHFATFSDCLWWAIISLTTVGYGDVFPITLGGKFFASVVLLLCIGIIATPAGLLASALMKQSSRKQD